MLKHRAESAADRSGGLPLKIDPAWLLSLLLAFGFREFIGGFTGHSLFLIVVLLAAAAALQVLWIARTLRTELVEPRGRLLVGDPVRVAVNLENRGMLTAPYVTARSRELGDQRVVSVSARDRANLTWDFLPRVRGVIDMGAIQLGVTDVLNILTWIRRLEPDRIKVYPNISQRRSREMVWSTVGEGGRFRSYARENPYIVRELRRYQPGDSIRKINWKVSAKFNDLFVRRGETTEEKDVLIILDMNQAILAMDPAGIYENTLVTDALTLSRGLLDQGVTHGVLLNDARGQYHQIANLDGFTQLEEDLVAHKADGRETLREFIARKNEYFHDRGTLIFFTRPRAADIDACEQLKYDRNEVVVFAPRLADSDVSREGRRLILRDLEGPGYEMA